LHFRYHDLSVVEHTFPMAAIFHDLLVSAWPYQSHPNKKRIC